MVYGLYGVFDQDRWFRNDFSSDDKLTGTIFTDVNQTSAKNLTGYTVTIRLSRQAGPGRYAEFFNKTATIVVAGDGTWSYAVAQGEIPQPRLYWISAQLTKSGTQETTINRVLFHVLRGPST